jgi:hypothetical protein
MSNSDWRSNLAVAGGVIAGLLVAVWFSSVVAMGPAPGKGKPSADSQQSQAKHRDARERTFDLKDQLPREAYEPACPEDDKKHECFMQWRSARAAEAQARAADEQALWTKIGTIALLVTLGLTFLATAAAAFSAKALVDNERPWVGVVSVTNKPLAEAERIDADVIIKNTGRTPAFQMQATFCGLIMETGLRPREPDVSQAAQKPLLPAVLDYYHPFLERDALSRAELDALSAGKLSAWIIGRVEYFDGQGRWRKRRHTRVCARWDRRNNRFAPDEDGNDAT